jgi:hypothetical protein
MYGRKYNVLAQNGDYSRESNVRTSDFRNKVRYQNATSLQDSIWKRSTSDNAIRRWLKQFQETGTLDISRVKKGAHVEVIQHTAVLILQVVKFF